MSSRVSESVDVQGRSRREGLHGTRVSGLGPASLPSALERPTKLVLFMSGYAESSAGQGARLDAGGAFLRKPFTPGALLGKVRESLDGPQERRQRDGLTERVIEHPLRRGERLAKGPAQA